MDVWLPVYQNIMLKYILNLGKLGVKASTKSFTFLFLLFLFHFVLSQIIITIIFYFFLICGTEMQGSWLVWGFCVMFFVPFSFLGGEVLCLSVLIFVIFFSLPFVSLCQIYHMKSIFGSVPFTGLVRLKYNTGYQWDQESCTSKWSKYHQDTLQNMENSEVPNMRTIFEHKLPIRPALCCGGLSAVL